MIRYFLFFLATLTAVGQSTKPDPNIVWFPDGGYTCVWFPDSGYACGHPDQHGIISSTIPWTSTPPLCLMKMGDYYVACPKPKKHKAPVKPAWDMTPPVDDGVAHWQAPKPPVPEAIKEGTICDHLPETQKITCLMNLIAPEKAADQKPEGYSPDGGCNWCQKDGPCTLRACSKTPDPIKTAPEKAAVREWKSDSCWMPNTTMSYLEWHEHCQAGGVPGPGMGDLVQPPADHKGWTGLLDPLKTAQDGYDCTMSRTPKTITINCTLKEK